MPCYHPMIRVEDRSKWEIAADGHKYHPARILKHDEKPDDIEALKEYSGHRYKNTIIPCGKCIGCRLEYSREWANRGMLEAKQYDNNWFVTLTYDDEHLPQPTEIVDKDGFTWVDDGSWEGGTLVPEHMDKFINHIRKIYEREQNHTGIRFMGCGEYGSEGGRPHYHIILFNMPEVKNDLYHPRIINQDVYYQSHIIERCWDKGISNICPATWNTIAYTARYITKKINGEWSEQLYASNGKRKEFMRMSTHPGIGKGYYDENKDDIYKNDKIMIKNKSGITYCKPPAYFDKLYEKENQKDWKRIQEQRKKDGKNKNLLKAERTSLFLRDQLEVEERTKQDQSLGLIRAMERSTR